MTELEPETLISAARARWLALRATSRERRRGVIYSSDGPARHALPAEAPTAFEERARRNSRKRRRAARESQRDLMHNAFHGPVT